MNNNLLDKLIQQEKDFLNSEFLAPVTSNNVNVRVNGIIRSFLITPPTYRGFGVFKPKNNKYAGLVREATRAEQQRYFDCLPRLILIVCSVERGSGLLFIKDGRFKIQGEVPIKFLTNVQLFDTVDVRFDGFNFWFERHNRAADRQKENSLREQLNKTINKPPFVKIDNAYNDAYQIALADKKKATLQTIEGKLNAYTSRANASLIGYRERSDGYSVDFEVDGEEFTSTVDKNFRVVSAGICLSGHDADFDLQQLVTVIREGQHRHLINRY